MQYRPPSSFPRLSRRTISYLAAFFVASFVVLQLTRTEYPQTFLGWTRTGSLIDRPDHPIDELVSEADDKFEALLNKTVRGLPAAAAAYRSRRGRHPPPEFDRWVEFAEQKDALIIEEFFDGIYDDLEPFWALSPSKIRELAASWPNLISIRKHNIKMKHGGESKLEPQIELLREIQALLPDVDLAFSADSHQAVIVPWETVQKALEAAEKSRPSPLPVPASVPFKNYKRRAELRPPNDDDRKNWKNLWQSKNSYWNMARQACPPASLARSTVQDRNFSVPPIFLRQTPYNSYEGFVRNWTDAKSLCSHPGLRNLHGALVGTNNERRHDGFFPLFAESKIQDVNNVIVFPSEYSWDKGKDQAQDADKTAWEDKEDKIIWRGEATGGRHNKNNWTRFQRHRFVAMANGTWVSAVEARPGVDDLIPLPPTKDGPPAVFPLPVNTTWSLSAIEQIPSQLGEWVNGFTDVAFTHFMCNPATGQPAMDKPGNCLYVEPHYSLQKRMDMPSQLAGKYVPDLDGTGVSSRFLNYLKSNSVPIKATIFSEWHDSRLVPWKHFVPMDNTFADWWAIMEYFLGYGGGDDKSLNKKGHDRVARAIAEQGSQWAKRVLRHEDVLVYIYRLILEYARVADDRRLWMGYTRDLL